MIILGLNSHHADSSACILKDGKLLAAVEEERFNRIKHWAGFPALSIQHCLDVAGCTLDDVDYIALNRDPKANIFKKIKYILQKKPNLKFILNRLRNRKDVLSVPELFEKHFEFKTPLDKKIQFIEHHLSHLASSYYVSGFDSAALLSVDGLGDFSSTKLAIGEKDSINTLASVHFPHSLGLFYTAMTQFLGYMHYGEEYKVMGLSSYGNPIYLKEMKDIVRLTDDGLFELNLDYFLHHSEGMVMSYEGGSPDIGRVFSDKWYEVFGSDAKDNLEKQQDIAASCQKMYEEALFHLLNKLHAYTKNDTLCLSGGCGYNSVANGKICQNTPFRNIYIQPASGDSGGAIGAAYVVHKKHAADKSTFLMNHAYWGPEYSEEDVSEVINRNKSELEQNNVQIVNCRTNDELCEKVAKHIASGCVIGWYQGHSEWGPRALGNRSILADPRRTDMKELLNAKIKRRESYRPFAPSIKRESVEDYFQFDNDVPFMQQVFPIKEDKRESIPAVTHVDGSGRLQTVSKANNALYWNLLDSFEKETGVPILLNTSFNENEPIGCTPGEALDCFLRTRMDVLVLGHYYLRKRERGTS